MSMKVLKTRKAIVLYVTESWHVQYACPMKAHSKGAFSLKYLGQHICNSAWTCLAASAFEEFITASLFGSPLK